MAKFSKCSLYELISVKTNGFPEYSWAASVKAFKRTSEFSWLNKETPDLLDPKISPIVLSSKGTTNGLWCFSIQFFNPSSIPEYVAGPSKDLKISTAPASLPRLFPQ